MIQSKDRKIEKIDRKIEKMEKIEILRGPKTATKPNHPNLSTGQRTSSTIATKTRIFNPTQTQPKPQPLEKSSLEV